MAGAIVVGDYFRLLALGWRKAPVLTACVVLCVLGLVALYGLDVARG